MGGIGTPGDSSRLTPRKSQVVQPSEVVELRYLNQIKELDSLMKQEERADVKIGGTKVNKLFSISKKDLKRDAARHSGSVRALPIAGIKGGGDEGSRSSS